jgi:hypothetical protein
MTVNLPLLELLLEGLDLCPLLGDKLDELLLLELQRLALLE